MLMVCKSFALPWAVFLAADLILKPGLHEPQPPVESSVSLVSSIVIEWRRWALEVNSVARLQKNKET